MALSRAMNDCNALWWSGKSYFKHDAIMLYFSMGLGSLIMWAMMTYTPLRELKFPIW